MTDPRVHDADPEEEYNSASDDDFDPTAFGDDAEQEADDTSSSSSGAESTTASKHARRGAAAAAAAAGATTSSKTKRKKRKRAVVGALDAEKLDSGDEATIKERAKVVKRQKVAGHGGGKSSKGGDDDDDEGGEGGFVKTRSQMRVEGKERKPLASTAGSSVDVDALWSTMLSTPIGQHTKDGSTASTARATTTTPPITANAQCSSKHAPPHGATSAKPLIPDEEMITIKRSYRFAGETVTEERRVPRSSAEARLYLSSREGTDKDGQESAGDGGAVTTTATATATASGRKPLRRPLRRPSRFDPNPTGEVKGLPPELQRRWWQGSNGAGAAAVAGGEGAAAAAGAENANGAAVRATKLNTVEKSKLDWVKHVDEEGLQEELDEYGRAKEGYMGRMEFLNRVEGRREEGLRSAKAK